MDANFMKELDEIIDFLDKRGYGDKAAGAKVAELLVAQLIKKYEENIFPPRTNPLKIHQAKPL
jgi:hypothetical protein